MNDAVQISRTLCEAVEALRFEAPVTHVYNPLAYARAPHEQYLTRFGVKPGRVMLLGMNPGPWGMAQTGVPFGEIAAVRDWMGIEAPVEVPAGTHPKRPIEGFACNRSEVSGARLWGWAQDVFGSAEAFFDAFFVANYCPLTFMAESGKNITPDKLTKPERASVEAACDSALAALVDTLKPAWVIGVGVFAEKQIRRAVPEGATRVARITHPSPASPVANRGWKARIQAEFQALGIPA